MNNQFLTQRDDIIEWLNSYRIYHYHIHDDLTIDVEQDVSLRAKSLSYLPIQFGQIKGFFDASYNQFKTLSGFPHRIEAIFNVSYNELSSLEGFPSYVGGDIYLHHNKLRSLKGLPNKTLANLIIDNNPLHSLKHCPEIVLGDFSANIAKLKSLKEGPRMVNGNYTCNSQELTTLEGMAYSILGVAFFHSPKLKIDQYRSISLMYFMHQCEKEEAKIEEFKKLYTKQDSFFILAVEQHVFSEEMEKIKIKQEKIYLDNITLDSPKKEIQAMTENDVNSTQEHYLKKIKL